MNHGLKARRSPAVLSSLFVIGLAMAAPTVHADSADSAQETGSCGDVCDGRPCTGFLIRSGTCQPGGNQCTCVPNTPAPGECALACDARPCVGQCSDGTIASGSCTFMTVDTGCRCALVCADSTPTPTPPASTPTPTVALGACAAACDSRPCTVFFLRSGTCQPSGNQCTCVPNTPAPGECALACDGRPCEGRCADGTMASGACTVLTVDTGCACAPVCADSTPTPTSAAPTPTPTVALGACAAACDDRPCVGQCPDGHLAPGNCTALTVDRGCTCAPDCAGRPGCTGDCNGDGKVTIDELMVGVEITLGIAPLAECSALDVDGDGRATINDLIAAVLTALVGECPG